MKKLIVSAVAALAIVALLPRPAAAGIWENGNWSNGIWENGIWENGIWENGAALNTSLLPVGELRGIAPRCAEARVELSAVPLAKVTVRLPRSVR
jgi:hypothetical protein